jgi:hypothetical protein
MNRRTLTVIQNNKDYDEITPTVETFSVAHARLRKEVQDNLQGPGKVPSKLPLKAIEREEQVFQVRGEAVDDERVRHIAAGLNWDKTDDAVHVFWTGRRWVLIEGHHRLAAYGLSKKNPKGTRQVPVIAHVGMSLQAAQGLASITNSREKVTIPQWKRLNVAWRMTCIGEGSIAQLARESGCGKSTISNMREAKAELLTKEWMTIERLTDAEWLTARAWWKGQEKPQDWTLEADEAKALEIAEFLSKHLNGYLVRRPETFARALSLVSEELPYALMQTGCWGDALKVILNGRDEDDDVDDIDCGF